MKRLAELSDRDLRDLAAALRSGRLQSPLTPFGVQRLLGSTDAGELAGELQTLHDRGMPLELIAEAADLLLYDRARHASLNQQIDLVTTGPDAPGIVNRDTSIVVRELFAQARTSVLLAGFAVYQGRRVFKTLAERMSEVPALDVRLFLDIQRGHGDTTISDALVRRFAENFRSRQWPVAENLPQVFFDPRSLSMETSKRSCLHAKCVVVDRETVFVTSANFTEAAQERNIEVGLLVQSKPIAEQLCGYFDALTANDLVSVVTW